MTTRPLTVLAAALAVALAGVALAPAFAQTAEQKALVDAAKQNGVVGETGEGLLAFVGGGGDPGLQAAVSAINAGRARAYAEAAAKAGVSQEAAGQAAARQVYARLPSGAYFKPLGGGWTKKP
jgi:uncharacterized protein YdbL (DUF1318 family)